ncbi:hypothetical protein A2U01_0091872, partial [Trifolium medium]|nr:hypothetical protein [Trifolium medium]
MRPKSNDGTIVLGYLKKDAASPTLEDLQQLKQSFPVPVCNK